MARVCKICTHPKRNEINEKLVRAVTTLGYVPFRQIAAEYMITPSALVRHRTNHLTPALHKAQLLTGQQPTDAIDSQSDSIAADPQDIAAAVDTIASETAPTAKLLTTLTDRVKYLWQEAAEGIADAKTPVTLRRKDGSEVTLPGDLKARASMIGTAAKIAEMGGIASGELHQAAAPQQPGGVAINILLGLPRGEGRPAPIEVHGVEIKQLPQGE